MKIKEFQSILKKRCIDFALFYNIDFERVEENMAYFSQYPDLGILIIPAEKALFLITPKIKVSIAKDGFVKKVYRWDKNKRLFENAKSITKRYKIKQRRIGIDKRIFSLEAYRELKRNFKKARFIDISKDCLKLRETKTKKEIEIIKKGCQISDSILQKCLDSFKKFKTEAEVKAFLEYETKKLGCELAFPTIVASGKNATEAHHLTKNIKLNRGFCVIDFGIRYKYYCTDTTRTIYLGKISKKEKEIYNFVLNVQEGLIRNVTVGKKCADIDKEAKKNLKEYAKYFTHGLGHGVGIKIHELPNLKESSKDKIKNNMIFTIEPGIYLKRLGIRIEDTLAIEDNKVKILTKIHKKLRVIG